MREEEVMKAFEGRWRVKGNVPTGWVKGVREMCLDFFEAGVAVGEGGRPYGEAWGTVDERPCGEAQGTAADFETWWGMYDKKRGREKCEKKWAKMSSRDKAACIAATPAYVASTAEKRFRKDPYTYLNQKAWNDEIIDSNGKRTSASVEQQRLDKLASIIAG